MSFPVALRRPWWPTWGRIETLCGLIRRPAQKFTPTSKLYILEVNFQLRPDSEAEKSLEAQRAYLLDRYGIDLMVLEPGYKLKRFDEV